MKYTRCLLRQFVRTGSQLSKERKVRRIYKLYEGERLQKLGEYRLGIVPSNLHFHSYKIGLVVLSLRNWDFAILKKIEFLRFAYNFMELLQENCKRTVLRVATTTGTDLLQQRRGGSENKITQPEAGPDTFTG